MRTFETALVPAEARRRPPRAGLRALLATLALLVALASALSAPARAYAFDDANYESNIENRGEGSSDDWDSEWLGGDKYPKFDVLNPLPMLKYFIYSLVEGIAGTCIGIANSLLDQIGRSDYLTQSFTGSALNDVYETSRKISETIIQPVAVGFLGLACVLALLEFSKEVATNKGDHFSMAGNYVWIIVKFALVMTLIGHTTMLCGGIYDVFLAVSGGVRNLLNGAGLTETYFSSFMIELQMIHYSELGSAVFMGFLAVIIMVVCAVTVVKIMVLMVTRMFELYIMTAFAGFPLVMVTTRETRPGGIGYFKRFAGICLQAAVLIVVIGFAGVFFSAAGTILHVADNLGIVSVAINFFAPLAGCFALSAMASQSRQIADSIMGAGA